MKRRGARRHADDPVDEATDTEAAEGADDPVVVWDETWAENEEERVARWLRARIGPTAGARGDRVRADSLVAPFGRPQLDLDTYRRDLVAAAEEAEGRIEQSRREAMAANAALEAEVRSLEDRRLRLEAGLEAQQAEYDHILHEHSTARSRLDEVIADLEARGAALEADLAAADAEADAGRTERLRRIAELHDRAGAVEQQRQELAAVVEGEYAEAEAVHQERLAEVARLEADVRSLLTYRDELAAAVEAERVESERARQVQEEQAAQLRAEIADLERQTARPDPPQESPAPPAATNGARVHAADGPIAVRAPAGEPTDDPRRREASAATAGALFSGPLDPSGRLAQAVSELGRHLASVLEAERARADRLAREQEAARARFEMERRLLEQEYGALPDPATGQGRVRRRRRRGARTEESPPAF